MFNPPLFLGLPLVDDFLHQLSQLPDALRNAFIQSNSSDYLLKVEKDGKVYLGKIVVSPVETSSLESLQVHIYSLLKKLIPLYPYEDHPLVLFAVDQIG